MFKPVDPKVNFVELEKKWFEWWKKNGIVEKYLHKNDSSDKRFSFIDGPITANNPMGVHHAWGRTYKDLWQKFKNMQGFKQRFQNGFDCQGLWVEVEVEKKLGFNSKKDIEKYGLDKFTNACKERVNTFAKKQTEQSERLGYFMDWENSYYTMSETNNLYIWRFLKMCHESGLIYKGKSATTWCPRCGTGLSKHEQADSYQEITDTAVYVKFKLKNRDNEYFLVWTTTPWTLSANVLLAINPQHKYVKTKADGDFYYLAEESAKRLGLNDYSLVKTGGLLNLEYEALYDIPAQKDICHYVTSWNLVNSDEGTGIVHIAPGCGEEDFELGKKLNAQVISPLDESGNFLEGYGDLTGEYANKVADKVIDFLTTKNSLYRVEPCVHSYPHCWRCKTKCLFRLVENWFINCQKIKGGLKKLANKVCWIPGFVGKRMENWLESMGDWMISRKRYYGLALPFYECKKCGRLTVIGSKEELKTLAVNPEKVDALPSLHRPWIDEIKIKCPDCGGETERVKDVGDCWLDAGVVPFSTLKYFEDKNYWKLWYPADAIGEMVEQVRLWYYSMLVYGYIFENKVPYKTVFNYVEVRDEKGERMSKTKRNGIPYDEAVEKMGADVMRWMYATQNPTQNLNFGYGIADETRRRFHLLLWNSYNYFVTYANIDGFRGRKTEDGRQRTEDRKQKNILDRWILSKLNNLIKLVTESLENYDAFTASCSIEKFVSDFSTWYIRRSRDRADKNLFYKTSYKILLTLAKILAPFTPFLAEEIFKNLTEETRLAEDSPCSGVGGESRRESVHLQNWPGYSQELIDDKLEENMKTVRKVCEMGHAVRKEKGVKVRQPLNELRIMNYELRDEGLIDLIKDELNVKEVEIKEEPSFAKATAGKEGELKVEFDTAITEELKAEGEVRDLIRQAQEARKEAGCGLAEKIKLGLPSWPENFTDEIQRKTLATAIFKADSIKVERNV